MSKYKRSIISILDEVINGMVFTISVDEVVLNPDGSQTLTACDIFYAQIGFNVTINSLSYKITDISHDDETITVLPNFTGVATINVGDTFQLYAVKFFHGTPITTQTELGKIVKAENKTPLIWLWENFKEKNFDNEIIEREIDVELYALTQTASIKLAQMENDNIHVECVEPMRRLIECFISEVGKRSDIFSSDFQDYDTENFPKFGIIARNKGADKAVFMDNLSGVACYTKLSLFYKDACECPVTAGDEGQFDDSFDDSFA